MSHPPRLATYVVLLLTACAQHVVPSVQSPLPGAFAPNACYSTLVAPRNVMATITFYGYPDNTPPGKAIAHPVIHRRAGGDGTYCNPTTFATEKANNTNIPYGTKIYVPFMKRYFVREDLCAASGPPVGSGSNGCYKLWFDLWIGGNAHSNVKALVACERKLTPNDKVRVIVDPAPGMPSASPGPVYRNRPRPKGSCDAQSMSRTIFPN